MRPSRVVVTVVAWFVVVTLGSTLVWTVISRAGKQVESQEPLVATAQQGPRTAPTDTKKPSPSSAQRRTWEDLGMLLGAECDGAAIRLVSASPADGYAVTTKDDGPDELEVEFEGREDEEGTSVTVTARCVGGVPAFTSTTQDD